MVEKGIKAGKLANLIYGSDIKEIRMKQEKEGDKADKASCDLGDQIVRLLLDKYNPDGWGYSITPEEAIKRLNEKEYDEFVEEVNFFKENMKIFRDASIMERTYLIKGDILSAPLKFSKKLSRT